LIQDGKIKARTKWKEVYPIFRDDKRYLDMLGNPGSNPLELFWDLVDTFDQKLDKKIVIVEDAIKRYNERHTKQNEDGDSQGDVKMNGGHRIFSIAPQTTWQAFCSVIDSELDPASSSMTEEDLRMVYKTVCLIDSLNLTWWRLIVVFNSFMMLPSRNKQMRNVVLNASSVTYRMTCVMR
jgi:pre-mRNA-processing factor 40